MYKLPNSICRTNRGSPVMRTETESNNVQLLLTHVSLSCLGRAQLSGRELKYKSWGKNNTFCHCAVMGLGLIAKKSFYPQIMMSWQFVLESQSCIMWALKEGGILWAYFYLKYPNVRQWWSSGCFCVGRLQKSGQRGRGWLEEKSCSISEIGENGECHTGKF